MPLDQFVYIALIVFFAAFIQALSGFGFGLLTVPLLVLVIDLRVAVVAASLIAVLSNWFQAYHLWSQRDRVLTKRFIAASCCGAPIGLAIFCWLPQDILKVTLGVAVLFGVFVLSRGLDLRETHHSFDWAMGVLSGILQMATSTGGPPLVFTLQARRIEPQVFRATLNSVFSVTGVVSASLFVATGKVNTQVLQVIALGLPLMMMGLYFGIKLRARIAPQKFRLLVLGLLSASGLSSILNALL